MPRDLAHEHDMAQLRREQLRADCSDDVVEEPNHEQEFEDFYYGPDPSDDEYWMGDPDEYNEEE